MAKSKDMETTKLNNGRVVEFEKHFFLHQLVEAIEQSEEIYSCIAHKTVAIGIINLLFFKFQLTEFMEKMEVSEADYKKWFEKLAIENNVDNFIHYKLFGELADGK
ncbi:MAG: hypothetical protein COB17_00780 [Sulfurimonas sp.]|nr:MAG: hypothetical protein COB17_00780 [Sulfurimonas sp.]